MNLKSKIREILDFPISGVNFKDITTLLQDAESYRFVIDSLIKPYENKRVDMIVGIDARGYLFASAMAYQLNAGIALVRKKGKLPYTTISEKYDLEYGTNEVEMHVDTIKKGQNVVIVDDLLATGGTMAASVKLVEKLGGNIVGLSFVIELDFLNGRKQLNNYAINSLVHYEK